MQAWCCSGHVRRLQGAGHVVTDDPRCRVPPRVGQSRRRGTVDGYGGHAQGGGDMGRPRIMADVQLHPRHRRDHVGNALPDQVAITGDAGLPQGRFDHVALLALLGTAQDQHVKVAAERDGDLAETLGVPAAGAAIGRAGRQPDRRPDEAGGGRHVQRQRAGLVPRAKVAVHNLIVPLGVVLAAGAANRVGQQQVAPACLAANPARRTGGPQQPTRREAVLERERQVEGPMFLAELASQPGHRPASGGLAIWSCRARSRATVDLRVNSWAAFGELTATSLVPGSCRRRLSRAGVHITQSPSHVGRRSSTRRSLIVTPPASIRSLADHSRNGICDLERLGYTPGDLPNNSDNA